jgi:hypothetical protein
MKKLMMKIMGKVMLSCLEFSQWIEKSHWMKISVVRKFQVWLHIKMCPQCEHYEERQNEIENLIMGKWNRKQHQITPEEIEHTKQQILASIQRNKF